MSASDKTFCTPENVDLSRVNLGEYRMLKRLILKTHGDPPGGWDDLDLDGAIDTSLLNYEECRELKRLMLKVFGDPPGGWGYDGKWSLNPIDTLN